MTAPTTPFSALLLPPGYDDAVLNGGAEVITRVVSSVSGDSQSLHLHILDHEEREEQLKREDLMPAVQAIHVQRLQELQEARDVLLQDSRFSQWLTATSHDLSLWPELESIRDAGETVSSLKEIADPPDLHSARSLLDAVAVITRELEQPGLYAVKPVAVSGSLVAYNAASTATKDHETLTANQAVAITQPLYRAQVDARRLAYSSAEVLELPMTAKSIQRIAELVTKEGQPLPVEADLQTWWREWVQQWRLHSKVGHWMAGSAGEMLRWWWRASGRGEDGESSLTSRLEKARSDGRRVRLQNGVYASVIHHHHSLLVIRSEAPRRPPVDIRPSSVEQELEELLGPEQVKAMEDLLHTSLSVAVRQGFLRLVTHRLPSSCTQALPTDLVETLVKDHFLSAALHSSAPLSSCCNCDVLQSTAHFAVIRCRSDFNPFLILHGVRVQDGFCGRRYVLDRFKRERDNLLSAQADAALLQSLREEPKPILSPSKTVSPGTTLVGEAYRVAVEAAIVKVLSLTPLTKTDLMSHHELAMFSSSLSFDPVVKAVLKKRTTYRSKKYELVE